MLRIRSAFHITHMVKDLDAATRLYETIFQPPIHFDGFHEGENRDASFASVSDAYIELFAPRDAGSPNPSSNGGRYLRRSGEGLHNFGWLIEDDALEAARFCEERGYDLVYVAGPARFAFFIHPKQAYGMMLEIAHTTIPDDPRTEPGWAAHWREKHPLGIERMNAVTFAVRDIDGAIGLLQDLTEAPVIHRGPNGVGDEECAFVAIADHVIELRRGLTGGSEIARFMDERGPHIHSVTFKVGDLAAVGGYLRSLGLRVQENPTESTITIDAADMMGARYFFTDQPIPSDPRTRRKAAWEAA